MIASLHTYIEGTSVIHRADARIKIALLLALSISVFLVQTWAALGLIALGVAAFLAQARLPLGRVMVLSVPLLVVLAFVVLFNSFSFAIENTSSASISGLAAVSAGFMTGWQPVSLWGSFGFVPEGFMRGLFYAARIMLILIASFVVTFTTTSNELCDAFVSFLKPLRVLRAPVDDIAMVLSIALRFIPLTAAEFIRIKQAQTARGAGYEEGSLMRRIMSWQTVLIPLVVGMFRRAEALSDAMDARCYGAHERTSLNRQTLSAAQVVCFLGLVAALIILDVFC